MATTETNTGKEVKGVGQLVVSQRSFDAHNPKTTLEEYLHYACISRAMEAQADAEHPPASSFIDKFTRSKAKQPEPIVTSVVTTTGEKESKNTSDVQAGTASIISDAEWNSASRAARTATWSAVFYLITTDIMGPYSVPYVSLHLQ